ncbi:MAG: M56 family metallopeptidase, partial [Planctomycetes bacterium]|nr:M56 family metallopeptidase [Planctomycetota bacterium]
MLTDWFLPNSLGVAIIWQMTACLLLALTASFIVVTRPARAHGLVSVGLLACLIAPLLSAGVRTAGWGFFAQSPVSLPGDAAASTDTAEGVDPLASIEAFAGLAGMHAGSPQTDPPEAGSGNLMDLAVGGNRIQPAVANSGIDPWTTLFVGVWAAMTLVLAARLALGLRAARRLVLNAQPCTSAKVKRALDTAADRLGVEAQAELLCSDGLHSPVICSWGAVPRILLPRDCLDDLPIDDLTAILCHELAHWKRRDHWTTMLSEVVRCAWPWHPAVWLATARLRRLGEMACDDWVIACGHRRQRYARSLLSLTPQRGAVFAIAATHGRRGLANRIHRILGHPRRHPQAGVKWTT